MSKYIAVIFPLALCIITLWIYVHYHSIFNKNVDFSETNGTEDIKKIEEKEEVKEAESVKIIAEEKETKETRETKEIREISKKREESETREIAQNIALSEGGMAEDALKDGMKYLVFSVVGVLLTLWILFKNI